MRRTPNAERHHRRALRLKGYDYTLPGAYFVTLCTRNRECMFGAVVNDRVRLNAYEQIAEEEWLRTPSVRPHVKLDVLVVMPNHLHGIIAIQQRTHRNANVGATRRVAPTKRPTGPAADSLGAIIGQFKSNVTKRINTLRGTPGAPVWQRNYYEHVIRNERDMDRIREYILNNPLRGLKMRIIRP